MKRIFSMLGAVALLAGGCESKAPETTTAEASITTAGLDVNQPANMTKEDMIERGKYLVSIGSCNDCHSPKVMGGGQGEPKPDPGRLLSGHPATEQLPPVDKNAGKNGWVLFSMGSTAMVGPWGTSFAANLTPDATGLGNWTLDNFKKALREGKYKGMDNTRTLLPPMPWPNYRTMKDEDVEAIFTYLKSIPAVKNIVPAPLPPAA